MSATLEYGSGKAARRRVSSLSFFITVALLALGAAAINIAVLGGVSFKKLPVALSQPLKEIPGQLGPWKQVFSDRPLEGNMEHTLGTEEYVFRLYADTRVVQPQLLDGVEDADENKRDEALRRLGVLQQQHPEAFIQFAMTYYTGMVDTVAHIPDRCYVADGYEPVDPKVVTFDLQPRPLQARFITFQDQTARGSVDRNVAYFFHVDGAYEYDPLTGVRLRLQDLREKHAYYSKVELMTQGLKDDAAQKVMTDFLSSAMPSVEKCLPDWKKVKEDEAKGK